MSAEIAPVFARTLAVRFTQPSELNDPFELRPLIDFEGTNAEFRDEIDARITTQYSTVEAALDMMEKQQRSDPNYPKMVVLISAARQIILANPALQQRFMAELQRHKAELLSAIKWEVQWERVQQFFGQALGILSLSEDPANTVMWSHYASRHYGVVVEFHDEHPWFHQQLAAEDEFRHLVKVSYITNPHPRTWRQLNGADVFYSKGAEWTYEKEWRIIRPLKDGSEIGSGIFCFEVPPATVKSLTFGCRTTQALETEIRALVGAHTALSHVRFGRARLAGGGKIEIADAVL
jgi:hypothetical protein